MNREQAFATVQDTVASIFREYWQGYAPSLVDAEAKRHTFMVSEVLNRVGADVDVADLGGGWGGFCACAAALGMRATLVDDFRDAGFYREDDPRHLMPARLGFVRVSRDIAQEALDFPANSLDVVTSFDSIEHWHRSPKAALHRAMEALRPGGLFFLGVPNAVNIRKRIAVPLGISNWSRMNEWYEQPEFRGHVREPVVRDLRYIARDLQLMDCEILGRNWGAHYIGNGAARAVAVALDRVLQPFPSLCSDIYLIGRKPG
jgi:SAM-dependent methyltransferase